MFVLGRGEFIVGKDLLGFIREERKSDNKINKYIKFCLIID